jgi:LmbE family N-acetylglucosaminyl deacetylase
LPNSIRIIGIYHFTNLRAIIAPIRWIYISPHLDDAALSAGGFIFDQTRSGNPVEIWTIVCGFPPPGNLTPLAQALHSQWDTGTAEEAVRLRRAEDIKAADILGAKAVHFDVPDCIYRRGWRGQPLYTDIFVQPHKAEAKLPDQIAQTIVPRLEPDDQVICQLGVGGHVDHILVRQAAERLKRPLWYVADVPYLFWHPEKLAPFVSEMQESLHPISEAGLQAWIEAILAHESQISSLFDNPEKVKEEIHSYYYEKDGLPLWGTK